MPNLTCPCGERIDLSRIPNPNGYNIWNEARYEQFLEDVVELFLNERDNPSQFSKNLFNLSFLKGNVPLQGYECTRCGRLAVFKRASSDTPDIWYVNEREKQDDIVLLSDLISHST